MKKLTIILSLLVVSIFMLAACAPAGEAETPIPGAPGEAEEGTPDPGTPPADIATPPVATPGEPGVRGADIIPPTGRPEATQLSELLDYRVVDAQGEELGSVDDYILNTCEAHIIYMVLDAGQALETDGDLVIIPFEVVTLGGGVIDVDNQTIVMGMDTAQFDGAPAIDEKPEMTTTEWEDDVRTHWGGVITLSNLTTECRVPVQVETEGSQGTERQAITRIAYASDFLQAQVFDGHGEQIGEVEEVILEPESGWMEFTAINPGGRLQMGQELIPAPMGALNIRHPEDTDLDELSLVLLVEREVLENAPRVDSRDDLVGDGWRSQSFQYWNQHVPMTRDQLP
jgi:sporulation protein YlmC with PRC-barrel domain